MSLLNVSAVRKRALALGQGKHMTQVSAGFIAAVERRLDFLLQSAVHRHPSKGRTLRDFNP
jgi:hypothetical protein